MFITMSLSFSIIILSILNFRLIKQMTKNQWVKIKVFHIDKLKKEIRAETQSSYWPGLTFYYYDHFLQFLTSVFLPFMDELMFVVNTSLFYLPMGALYP